MRLLYFIVLTFIGSNVNGQENFSWSVGYITEFSFDKSVADQLSRTSGNSHKNLQIDFEPYISTIVLEKWEFGIALLLSKQKNLSYFLDKKIGSYSRLDLGIGGHARYNLGTFKKITPFVQSKILRKKQYYQLGVQNGTSWSTHLSLYTGVNFYLKKHLRILVTYGEIEYSTGQYGAFERPTTGNTPKYLSKDFNHKSINFNHLGIGVEWTY